MEPSVPLGQSPGDLHRAHLKCEVKAGHDSNGDACLPGVRGRGGGEADPVPCVGVKGPCCAYSLLRVPSSAGIK